MLLGLSSLQKFFLGCKHVEIRWFLELELYLFLVPFFEGWFCEVPISRSVFFKDMSDCCVAGQTGQEIDRLHRLKRKRLSVDDFKEGSEIFDIIRPRMCLVKGRL